VGTDRTFFESLKRIDGGEEESDQEDISDNDEVVGYDEIDSSKTINEAIQDTIRRSPANCLGDIYADEEDKLNESDSEGRGAGINLGKYIGDEFTARNATEMWMNWDGE
jgi:hypothetical protein